MKDSGEAPESHSQDSRRRTFRNMGGREAMRTVDSAKAWKTNEIFPSLGHSIPNSGVLWFEHKHYFNSVGMELLLKLIMHLSIF